MRASPCEQMVGVQPVRSENSDLITTTSTSFSYDNYGNASSITKTVTDNDPGSPYNGQTWTTTTTNTTDASGGEQASSLREPR